MHVCALHVVGADKASIPLTGPASNAAELPKDVVQVLREVDEESDEKQESVVRFEKPLHNGKLDIPSANFAKQSML